MVGACCVSRTCLLCTPDVRLLVARLSAALGKAGSGDYARRCLRLGRRVCSDCGASMADRAPQAKFCSTSCKRRFGRRERGI